MIRIRLITAVFLLFNIHTVYALDTTVDTFFQWHVASRTSDVDCATQSRCSVPFNDQRFQIKAQAINDSGLVEGRSKLEILHDSTDDVTLQNGETTVPVDELYEAHEAYLVLNLADYIVSAGRQVVTWGVGDLLFVNDIFPKDWIAFYSGQPMEYLKRGMDMVRANVYTSWVNLDIIAADFREDRLPENQYFVFENPSMRQLPSKIDEPSQMEKAIRLSRYVGNWDVALYASDGFFRRPATKMGMPTQPAFYPSLETYGLSLSGPLINGVVNMEYGHYRSKDDSAGTIPTIQNSSDKLLFGYSRQIGSETTISIQYYLNQMQDYEEYFLNLPAGFMPEQEYQRVSTFRLTQFYLHNTLSANFFIMWEHQPEGSLATASLKYAIADNLWTEIGVNYFSGDAEGMFGQLDNNDILYFTMRYSLL